APDALGLRAATADDDARPGGVNVDLDTVTGPLDLHLGDARPVHAPLQHAPDLDVFLDVVLVELVREPHDLVVGRDAEPEPVRVDLLTHYRALLVFLPPPVDAVSSRDSTTTVMWLVRLLMR